MNGVIFDGLNPGYPAFQFGTSIEDNAVNLHEIKVTAKKRVSHKKHCIRIALLLFLVIVILCVATSIALILTQKPIDFDDTEEIVFSSRHMNASQRAPYRRYPTNSFITHSIEDVITSQPHRGPSLQWLSDDTLLVKQFRNYMKVDLANVGDMTTRTPYIQPDELRGNERHAEIIFGSNNKLIALGKIASRGFRYSKKSLYDVARIENGFVSNRTAIGPYGTGNEPLQLFHWNPKADSSELAFVYENNVYYQKNPYDPATVVQITTSGSEYQYYGVTDWLYEEEIFGDSNALWWSKSGDYLAYAMFDDSNVSKVLITVYRFKPYPTYQPIAYPKVGEKHQPSVLLWIWNKHLNDSQLVMPPEQLLSSYVDNNHYLFAANWVSLENDKKENEDYLVAIWANRNQNQVFITACQYGQSCRLLKQLDFDLAGMKMWAEPCNFKIEYSSRTGFFLVLPYEHSNGNVYEYVAHVQIIGEGKYRAISGYHGGAYDVSKIVGYDKGKDELYFLAQGPTIGEMHMFRVLYASTEDNISPQCVTCLINGCKQAAVDFAPSGTQMLITCSSAFKNSVVYYKKTNNILKHWQVADNVPEYKPQWDLPSLKMESLELSSGFDANVRIILPPNFNSNFSYPVLLHLYAGPNSVMVSDNTPMDIMTYFAAVRQYIVLNIDGRGSAHRGWRIREPIYRNLGGPEIEDQLEALKLLLDKYSFLDPTRVATFGWSYGGFGSAHLAILDGGNAIQCAISVAPVSDFRFYDSAYTERYMLQPDENNNGYEKSSLLSPNKFLKLKNVKFMLAHGEADDNVHYQNSALLAYALQENDIHFTQLVYTNQDHSIGSTRLHLFTEFDTFLTNDCFQLNPY